MKTVSVKVREDHLENLARTKPMTALAELVWNALDADATEVRVEFITNELEGLDGIRIVDNGHGLDQKTALIVFQNLGGSWKRDGARSRDQHRILHGKYGKGRFRAFSLGNKVTWDTVSEAEGIKQQFTITGDLETLGEFRLSDPKEAAKSKTGTVVEILNPPLNAGLLRGVKAQDEATQIFALYLRQYPGVKIIYDGTPLDPANAERHYAEYGLGMLVTENGERIQAELAVVEWTMPGKRGICLCDENGFMLHRALPRLFYRGFSYTAYLKSPHIAALERQGLLQAEELSGDVRLLLDAARRKLREHFTLREAECAQDVLDAWKEEEIYPYSAAPATPEEGNERRIFDIYATHLHQIFPDFAQASYRSKKLTLTLLQELVRSEPVRVARVLDSLLDFPEEKEEEVLALVQS